MCELLPSSHEEAHAESQLPNTYSSGLGPRRTFHDRQIQDRFFTILLLNFQQKIQLCGLLKNSEKHKLNQKETQLLAFFGNVQRNWGKGQKSKCKIISLVVQQNLLLPTHESLHFSGRLPYFKSMFTEILIFKIVFPYLLELFSHCTFQPLQLLSCRKVLKSTKTD